jgi:hypothetical protein
MTPQDENRETVQTSAYNPFPEPQTIPSGWDTSGFFSAPEPVSATEADSASEADNH